MRYVHVHVSHWTIRIVHLTHEISTIIVARKRKNAMFYQCTPRTDRRSIDRLDLRRAAGGERARAWYKQR